MGEFIHGREASNDILGPLAEAIVGGRRLHPILNPYVVAPSIDHSPPYTMPGSPAYPYAYPESTLQESERVLNFGHPASIEDTIPSCMYIHGAIKLDVKYYSQS